MNPIVYRWPGSKAAAVAFVGGHYSDPFVTIAVHIDINTEKGFVFDLHHDGDLVFAISDGRVSSGITMVERKYFYRQICGLLLDLGVDRRTKALMGSAEGVDHPWSETYRFVPDEVWDRRYESIQAYASTDDLPVAPLVDEPWLGHIRRLIIRVDEESEAYTQFYARWGMKTAGGAAYDPSRTTGAETLREIADQICSEEKLLPERDRQSWLEEHVAFGEFVLPSPEEVALYRMVGERLPLLWPAKEFEKWVAENER